MIQSDAKGMFYSIFKYPGCITIVEYNTKLP